MTLADTTTASASGRFKTLIIGAGVAGTSLAALLGRWGERPVIVERGKRDTTAGYNLGIYPVGGRITHGLGLFPRFADMTAAMRRYQLFNGVGHQMRDWDLAALFEKYGPI